MDEVGGIGTTMPATTIINHQGMGVLTEVGATVIPLRRSHLVGTADHPDNLLAPSNIIGLVVYMHVMTATLEVGIPTHEATRGGFSIADKAIEVTDPRPMRILLRKTRTASRGIGPLGDPFPSDSQ